MKWEQRLSSARRAALIGLLAIASGQAQQRSLEVTPMIDTASHPDELPAKFDQPQPQSLPLPGLGKLSLLNKAYLDVFNILRDDNSCSRFYGGPAAIEVLNRLTQQLEPSHLGKGIGLRMKGATTLAQNYSTRISYRVFEKAQLNLDGPFYKGVTVMDGVPGIGLFQPNTRQARATILLHELGHLIRTPNKEWLLPNDGDSDDRSRENTRRVIAVCTNQITQLEHLSFEQELLIATADRPRAATELANR